MAEEAAGKIKSFKEKHIEETKANAILCDIDEISKMTMSLIKKLSTKD